MTNLAVIATIVLATNHFLHPSGNWLTNVVSAKIEVPINYEGRTVLLSTNVPLYTNVFQMEWTKLEIKPPRNPLSITDAVPKNLLPPVE